MDDATYNDLLSQSNFFKIFNEISKKSIPNGPKLNIGAGPNIFPYPGWINYDRENFDQYFNWVKGTDQIIPKTDWPKEGPGSYDKLLQLQNYLKDNGENNFQVHDLRKGFSQHGDNTVEAIYVGQTIEHLNPIYEVPTFLNECFRILKPGKVLRMTTPDLDLLIQAYLNGQMDKFAIEQPDFYKTADPSAQLAYVMYGACGPKCTFDHYEGHMCLYTKKSMADILQKAQFKDITFYYETGKSKDSILQKEVTDAGMTHSFIVEAIK